MTDHQKPFDKASRRDFLNIAATAAAAVGTGLPLGAHAQAQSPAAAPAKVSGQRKPNLIFVFTDQERYERKPVPGLSMPGHEYLQANGVTFHNHYGPAVMCTSSRAVMVTGLHTPNNGMYENVDVPWMRNLSTKIPTIGHMLRKAGYYTAYKGKWHLNSKFESEEVNKPFTKEMEAYGFADYYSPGDQIGHTLGGYQFDHLIAGSAVTWLRRKGRQLTDEGKPWCLFVSMVNPHDIMYFNTDAPGAPVQDTGRLNMHAAPAPNNEIYKATWDVPVPENLRQPFDEAGRPKAHGEFNKMWGYVLGTIPPEEERWRRFRNFYINSTRSVDAHLMRIIQEMKALSLADSTAFVFTSDHGEMAGAHGLRGKGPFAYEESSHLPLYIVHPDVKGGQDSKALTSHVDLVPTLLAMAGVEPNKSGELAGRDLPGKNMSPLLSNAGSADVNALRDSTLFTYSGLSTNDGDLWRVIDEAKAADKNPAAYMLKQGYKPDMKKRGSLRSTMDGRYRFTRYFAPGQRNMPRTMDELFKWNDVELYDLQADPAEMNNLAKDRVANKDLIERMNGKLNKIIKAEIGADDGQEMPNIPLIDWSIKTVDL